MLFRSLHNMRRHGIPKQYVVFVSNVLTGCKTRLKFDDFTSGWVELDNSIGQGDPLSMILYLFYNADILDIAHGQDELMLGYMDDIALLAAAKTPEQAHMAISDMVTWPGRALNWSTWHNSMFEVSKSVLIDFSHSRTITCPPMMLWGIALTPQPTHKFPGVMLDQELRWNQQASYAMAKASKWILVFRHLACPLNSVIKAHAPAIQLGSCPQVNLCS